VTDGYSQNNIWGCIRQETNQYYDQTQTYTDTFSGSVFLRNSGSSPDEITAYADYTSSQGGFIIDSGSSTSAADWKIERFALGNSTTKTTSSREGSFTTSSIAYSGYTDCSYTTPAPAYEDIYREGSQTLSGLFEGWNMPSLYYNQLTGSTLSGWGNAYPEASNTIVSSSLLGFYTNYNYENGECGQFSNTATIADYYFTFDPLYLAKYKVNYYERFISSTGSAINGYKIYNGGKVYSVEVTEFDEWGNPIYNDYPAEIIPIFESGSIIRANVLYGGKTYTNVPSCSIYGGYTTASVQLFLGSGSSEYNGSGSVVSCSVIDGGNYLPIFKFNKPAGGVAATASVYIDQYGTINSMSFSNRGSGYTGNPSFTLSGSFYMSVANDIYFNMGIEIPKQLTWNGQLPTNYTASVSSTYPTLPFYSVESASLYSCSLYYHLTGSGTTQIADMRYSAY
jgi:hypothetical protein